MDIMELAIDFHKRNNRQGPGGEESTLRALSSIPDYRDAKRILDIGCGTGGQTMVLAENTKADITAIDLFPAFLDMLEIRTKERGLTQHITATQMSMDALEFPAEYFDILWAEGCIYHIGFEKGLAYWKQFIKPGGYMAVSEICWLTDTRPKEIEDYWVSAYAEIGTIGEKLRNIQGCGYECINHFILPESDWANYYTPILKRSPTFLEQHRDAPGIEEFIDAGYEEAKLYEKYKSYYSYVFFILKNGIAE